MFLEQTLVPEPLCAVSLHLEGPRRPLGWLLTHLPDTQSKGASHHTMVPQLPALFTQSGCGHHEGRDCASTQSILNLSGSLLSSWVHAWRTLTQPSKPISSGKPAQPTYESDTPSGTLRCPGLSHRGPHRLAVCGCLPTQHDSMRPGPQLAPSLSAQNKAMASHKCRSAGLQTDNIRGAVGEGSGCTAKIWPSKCW